MKKILFNLALIDLNNFCRDNPAIDCGVMGTHVIKAGRGFKYTLVTSDTKRPLVTVQFHKSQVPTHAFAGSIYGRP